MSKLAAISSSRSVSGIRRVGSDDADLLGLKERGPRRCGVCAAEITVKRLEHVPGLNDHRWR